MSPSRFSATCAPSKSTSIHSDDGVGATSAAVAADEPHRDPPRAMPDDVVTSTALLALIVIEAQAVAHCDVNVRVPRDHMRVALAGTDGSSYSTEIPAVARVVKVVGGLLILLEIKDGRNPTREALAYRKVHDGIDVALLSTPVGQLGTDNDRAIGKRHKLTPGDISIRHHDATGVATTIRNPAQRWEFLVAQMLHEAVVIHEIDQLAKRLVLFGLHCARRMQYKHLRMD